MEKTVKIRAFPDDAKSNVAQGNPADDQSSSFEVAKLNTQLEEERKLSLEQMKKIEQLRENLKQEQAKTAEMAKKAAELEAKLNESGGSDVGELAVKEAQLEEEKSRSLENLKTIVQLRASLKQEQEKAIEIARKMSEQDAKVRSLAELEAQELAKKNAQIEEVKNKSLEQAKTIEQLRESLQQEQAKAAELADKAAGQEAKARELAALEARVSELTGALGKIAAIAAAGKADSDA